jgi:hypothetical protein
MGPSHNTTMSGTSCFRTASLSQFSDMRNTRGAKIRHLSLNSLTAATESHDLVLFSLAPWLGYLQTSRDESWLPAHEDIATQFEAALHPDAHKRGNPSKSDSASICPRSAATISFMVRLIFHPIIECFKKGKFCITGERAVNIGSCVLQMSSAK